jgi:hypothetical protein
VPTSIVRTAEETAILLAFLLKRSGETRVRVSEKTIRRVSQRSYIRTAFVNMLVQHLDDLGLSMMQLERGGYGLIRASVLEGAPTVTAKSHLQDVLKELKKNRGYIKTVRDEVERDLASEDDDE